MTTQTGFVKLNNLCSVSAKAWHTLQAVIVSTTFVQNIEFRLGSHCDKVSIDCRAQTNFTVGGI